MEPDRFGDKSSRFWRQRPEIVSNAKDLINRRKVPEKQVIFVAAAVAELADALDSGSSVHKTCRFNSCQPHLKRPILRAFLFFLTLPPSDSGDVLQARRCHLKA